MAYVQKTGASSNGPSSVAPSLTGVTAGNTLLFLMSGSGAPDVTPTDSAGQTWAKIFYFANGTAKIGAYWLQSANAGTHTVTWNAGSAADIAYTLVEIPACSAVDVTSTLGSASSTVTTISTPSITTTNATDALLAVLCCDAGNGTNPENITDPVSGFTTLFVQQNSISFVGASHIYKEVTSTGAQSATWTFNADVAASLYAAAMLSLKQGAAGVSFAGGGIAKATGSGTLTTQSVLAGAGSAKAVGSGTLSSSGGLAGGGTASASGSGTLSTRSKFAGGGVATATGSGIFTIASPFVPGNEAVWLVPARSVVAHVPARQTVAQAAD